MTHRMKILGAVGILILLSLACNISLGAPEEELSEEDRINTAVAEALATSSQGQTVATATQQQVVATTAAPTAGAPTSTPKPCNRAVFISETIPDGTDYNPNTNFTKSWRFRNDGTCTWNTSYQLVFYSGDQMSGPAVQNFTQNVAPGEQVDISVALKSPGSAGSYKGYWKLRDDHGEYYVNNMWVAIDVVSPVPTAPDLIITEFSINPATPQMGVPCHVRVGAYNDGNAAAGSFIVRWYGLSTFANPSCSWVLPSMVAHGGQILECDFTFSSWYPINKTSIVYIDHDSQVAESNEGNNTATISPFGVSP